MNKAVISTGGKQYFVKVGETIEVELIKQDQKVLKLKPLLTIDEDGKTRVGTPNLDDIEVSLEIVESEVKQDKVTAIRYKAKKRVKKVRGHRQKQTILKVTSIK